MRRGFHEEREQYFLRRAGEMGVNPDDHETLSDLETAVDVEVGRRAPCTRCGSEAVRSKVWLCDGCVESDRLEWEAAKAQTAGIWAAVDAEKAIGRLPGGRRRLVERSGAAFSTAAEVQAEAYSEW